MEKEVIYVRDLAFVPLAFSNEEQEESLQHPSLHWSLFADEKWDKSFETLAFVTLTFTNEVQSGLRICCRANQRWSQSFGGRKGTCCHCCCLETHHRHCRVAHCHCCLCHSRRKKSWSWESLYSEWGNISVSEVIMCWSTDGPVNFTCVAWHEMIFKTMITIHLMRSNGSSFSWSLSGVYVCKWLLAKLACWLHWYNHFCLWLVAFWSFP